MTAITLRLKHSPDGRRQALETTGRQRWHGSDKLKKSPAFEFAAVRKHADKVQERGGFAVVSLGWDEAGQKFFFRPWINLLDVRTDACSRMKISYGSALSSSQETAAAHEGRES